MRVLIKTIGILAVLMVIYGFAYHIEIPYSINSRGIIMPQREWRLSRLPDGTVMNSEKDNRNNNVSFFSVLEFQRGDHARFVVNENIFSGTMVKEGDTVGRIISFEEEQRLLHLQTRLTEQKGLLAISLSGEKQEKINAANEKINLALQEYDTQKRLLARMESLHGNGVIADEEWDLARNNYLVKKLNINIARAELEMLQSGAKSEEIDLIRANISSLEKMTEQAEKRLEAFNIQAPFSGTIIREQVNDSGSETIIRIADMEKMVITLPVELHQIPYIENGSRVNLKINSRRKPYEAQIVSIDNTIHYIDRRQNIFVTAVVENNPGSLMPNMLVQAEITSEPVSGWDYLRRIFTGVFEN
jgi:multidrug efflux pump subunit AcrA (membrane-fusion protein)